MISRAGLTFFIHYLEVIGIYQLLEGYFGSVRQSAKGISVKKAFQQLICFFLEGTNLHLTYFDERKKRQVTERCLLQVSLQKNDIKKDLYLELDRLIVACKNEGMISDVVSKTRDKLGRDIKEVKFKLVNDFL